MCVKCKLCQLSHFGDTGLPDGFSLKTLFHLESCVYFVHSFMITCHICHIFLGLSVHKPTCQFQLQMNKKLLTNNSTAKVHNPLLMDKYDVLG